MYVIRTIIVWDENKEIKIVDYNYKYETKKEAIKDIERYYNKPSNQLIKRETELINNQIIEREIYKNVPSKYRVIRHTFIDDDNQTETKKILKEYTNKDISKITKHIIPYAFNIIEVKYRAINKSKIAEGLISIPEATKNINAYIREKTKTKRKWTPEYIEWCIYKNEKRFV